MIGGFTLTPRQARTGLDLVTGLVVVSVAVALAGLTWRIAGHAGTGAVTVPSGASGPAVTPDIAPALALAPFGKAVASDAGMATALPLELKGVFAARPAELSVAYISVSGAPATAFRVGEKAGGGTVTAILRDRVILSNGGRSEFLAFPDPTLSPEQRSAAAAKGPAQPPLVPGVAPAQGIAPPVAAAPNPVDVLQRLDATPVSGGYRVGANGPPGMQSGDVIQSVNGTALSDPSAAQGAFAAAQASGSAQIQILRNGKPLTLTVPLR
ncbi:MAG: signaling protein [Sphingomonas sp.]|uniref:type II secretion system protein N n=1 Tax=Sphingomonas sp. TaxID=28214 RepID=UPI0025E86490|nr:type II secretion system protein N [Sphingomonas sp.]MBX3564083.1 signaling protein [Sphingomonas sp.]